jgi:O-antigen/teichoic acid export membrane protein
VFAVLVVAARRLPTAAFGVFSLASTLGWMLAVATDFGLQLHFAREITRAPGRLASLLPPFLRLRAAMAAAGIAAAVPLAYLWIPPAQVPAFVAIVAASVVSSLVEFLNYGYRAVSRSELESTLNLVQRAAALVLTFALLAVSPGLGGLAAGLLAPAVTVLVWSVFVIRRLAAREAPVVGPPFSMTAALGDALPIGAGIVLSALYFRVDLFLVEHWRGLTEVARYNAVFRLVDALRLFPAAVLAVLLPAVFQRRDVAFTRRLGAGLTTFGVLVAAAGLAGSSTIVRVAYGAAYADAAPMLRVLLLAFPLLCLNYGLTHQLIGWGAQRAYAVICAAALGVNVSLNVALVPTLGGLGAAWATLATEAALTIMILSVLGSARSHASSPPAPSTIPPGPDPAAPVPPRARRL